MEGIITSIESIEKVRVLEVSPVLRFNRGNVDAQKQGYGVYLIFAKPSPSFLQREYCKIGRAAGKAPNLYRRLVDNLNYHGGRKDECRDGKNHFFQVLYCDSPTDAGRLEALFHLWHGGYQHAQDYNPRMPIEPKHKPSGSVEPDFFVIQPG